MSRLSLRFWAWVNIILWFGSFGILFFWLWYRFRNPYPGPEILGMLTEFRIALLEIYSPYFGIILGSALTILYKKRIISGSLAQGVLTFAVLVLGFIFNLYFGVSIYDFAQNESESKMVLHDLRVVATWIAILMVAAMSYFFNLVFDVNTDVKARGKNEPSKQSNHLAPDNGI